VNCSNDGTSATPTAITYSRHVNLSETSSGKQHKHQSHISNWKARIVGGPIVILRGQKVDIRTHSGDLKSSAAVSNR